MGSQGGLKGHAFPQLSGHGPSPIAKSIKCKWESCSYSSIITRVYGVSGNPPTKFLCYGGEYFFLKAAACYEAHHLLHLAMHDPFVIKVKISQVCDTTVQID